MPNPNPKIFKKSLLAATVLSISGCASAPKMDGVDLSPIGAGIITAGEATAKVGKHAWDVSMYMLGFTDSIDGDEDAKVIADGEVSDDFLMDEIDQAMLEDDALLPEDTLSPVAIENATANFEDVFETPTIEELALLEDEAEELLLSDPKMEDGDAAELAEADPFLLDETGGAVELATANPDEPEFIHTVSQNETLWEIAKKTTGDATNWHVLADVNNLNQNAGVRAGQKLVIPTKMLKPELAATIIETQSVEVAANPIKINTQDIAAAPSKRLEIPTAEISGKAIKLNPSETLWDFAKRTTGDATNWKTIAGHNNFSEKQAVQVRAGQVIMVPDSIVKSDAMLASNTPAKVIEKPATSAEVVAAVDSKAITASSEMLSEASSLSNTQRLADETQPITIVEANYSDPENKPISIAADAQDVQSLASIEPDLNNIMVSGTYYPKAIYNSADFSSSLLMRVSPGTSLKVSKAMGNWFEVETEKGTGYVHKRDIK
ncbi:MAG: LysM peptidoglycan-binding domain-containing protein [Granulosicoccus sp.]